MTAYYNEIDPYAAEWLRNLIDARHIAPGIVDERDIRDIPPAELAGYTQCHFFAGIGVWSYALREAGWPDDRPVWTGSCPCQPFSAAGAGKGVADERHLWPHWFHLISQCEPESVFGEQVSSKGGLGWFDTVQSDMEGAGYAVGALDICAASVGSPHIRQRLYFAAERMDHAAGSRQLTPRKGAESETWDETRLCRSERGCASSGLAQSDSHRREKRRVASQAARHGYSTEPASCANRNGSAYATNGFWRDADWLFCRDGKWRPVEPGTFPLVDGAVNRVGQLRAYGNAICAPQATAFIGAYLETAE